MSEADVIKWPLFTATRDALTHFHEYLPPGAMGDMPTDGTKLREHVNEWAKALIGVSLSAIPDAASRWMRDPELVDAKGRTRIPSIASFGMYARRVDGEYHRPPRPQMRPRLQPGENAARIDELGKRAKDRLGSHMLASQVWDVLREGAATPEIENDIRAGIVSDQEFDLAIEFVRQSVQPKAVRC
jgi:hypothetical protein